MRTAEKGAGDGQALLFATRDLHPTFTYDSIEPLIGSAQKIVSGCLAQNFEALLICCIRFHELKIFAN